MASVGKPVVLITGPSGYLGANVFDALLKAGYHYAAQSSNTSFAIVPDLQAPGALDDAVQDVTYLCHVGSPYSTSANDPIKELAAHLKRVTVVSSFASVVDLSKNPRGGYVYTEEDWNPVTPEQAALDGILGYHASKTFAERTAWETFESAKNGDKISWDLVTFNAPMIYDPPIHDVDPAKGIDGLGTSLKTLVNGVTSKMPAFAPKVGTPGLPAWVDVRNVAEAHVNALDLPAGVSERFLLCGGTQYSEDGLGQPRKRGEKGLGEEGKKINQADNFTLDVNKAKKTLEFEFVPFEKTVTDTWDRLKELKVL